MTSREYPAPWEQTQEEFIGYFLIGDMFDVDARTHEWVWDDEQELIKSLEAPLWTSDGGDVCIRPTPKDWADSVDYGYLYLIDTTSHHIVGYYIDAQCWVHDDYRGRGYGTRLTVEANKRRGYSTVAPIGGLGFTEAGLAIHRAAHRVLVEEALEAGKTVPERVLIEYHLENTLPDRRTFR